MNMNKIAAALAAALLVIALPSCKKPNHPPDTPAAPSGPDSGAVGDTLTFTASATDPDDDSVSIRFDWGYGDTSDWSALFASGETVAATHAWPEWGTYAVKAQARDAADSVSNWSAAAAVHIDSVIIIPNEPPDRPYGVCGPDRGRRFIEYEFAASSRDNDGNRVSLRFDWGDGDTSDWSDWVDDEQLVYVKHSWSDGMTFELRAQSRDPEGALSEWTYPMTYRIDPQDSLLLWRLDVNADCDMCPAIGPDGTIYAVGPDGISASSPDGTLRWAYRSEARIWTPVMVGPDGTLYAGSHDRCFLALYPDGNLKWRGKMADGPCDDLALAADGTIYYPSGDGRLYALFPDGSVRWYHRANGGTPAIAADGTIMALGTDTLFALNPDGSTRWTYPVRTSLSPVIGPAGITYVAEDHNLLAIDSAGSLKWRGHVYHGRVCTSPVIAEDGSVYVGADERQLYAFGPDTTPKWFYDFDYQDMERSPAVTSDGTIYATTEDNAARVYALDANGAVKWQFSPCGSDVPSAVSVGQDGTVYVIDDTGYLSALRGSAPLADSPWPKFHHDLANTGRVGGR